MKEFHDALSKSPDVAVAVAAIRALTTVIRNSSAQTIMGLYKELEEAAQALQRWDGQTHVASVPRDPDTGASHVMQRH